MPNLERMKDVINTADISASKTLPYQLRSLLIAALERIDYLEEHWHEPNSKSYHEWEDAKQAFFTSDSC